jgi:hypothetical protein
MLATYLFVCHAHTRKYGNDILNGMLSAYSR